MSGCAQPQDLAASARRRALLVGIDEYRRDSLRGCRNDVAAVQEYLHQRGFEPAHVHVLCDGQATRTAILTGLRALATASAPGDVAVFYFCGHGIQVPCADPREVDLLDEALCPVDFDGTSATALLDDELARIFDSFAAGVGLTWVVDACHVGELDEHLDARVAARQVARPAAVPSRPETLAHSPCGVMLTACAGHERAAAISVDGVPHGAFTYHLLAAARRRPQATAQELMDEVCRDLAPIGQHPVGHGPGLRRGFLTAPGDAPAPAPPPRRVAVPTAAAPSGRDSDRHLHVYLAEASRRASGDRTFSAKLDELGVDLSGISAADAAVMTRAAPAPTQSGAPACRAFWWGFHLALPPAALARLAAAGGAVATTAPAAPTAAPTTALSLAGHPVPVPPRAAPHVAALTRYLSEHFAEVRSHDRGAGVLISMSLFAPGLFVTTAIPPRVLEPRRPLPRGRVPLQL